jgi:hypothetical protein
MKTLFVILFFCVQGLYAQDKVEREYKIKPSAVPAKALDFIKESFRDLKVNWYMEQSASRKSIEAKIRKDDRLYSAEFDTLGNIQDVEVLVNIKDIPEAQRHIIDRTLGEQFSRFKVQKAQKQWIGEAADLQSLIKGDKPKAKHKTNYEIVITGRKDKHSDEYELLFSEDGVLIRQQKIIESNQQHLIF